MYAKLKGTPHSHIRATVQQVAERVEIDGDPFRKKARALPLGAWRVVQCGMRLSRRLMASGLLVAKLMGSSLDRRLPG